MQCAAGEGHERERFLPRPDPQPLCRKAFFLSRKAFRGDRKAFRFSRKAFRFSRKAFRFNRKACRVNRKACQFNRKACRVNRKACRFNRKACRVNRKACRFNRKACRSDRKAFRFSRKAFRLDRMAFFLKRKKIVPGRSAAMVPPEAGFAGRNRRPPRDPMNALLSFGYVLMGNELQSLLDGMGFDPYLGRLLALLDPEEDSLRLYHFCRDCGVKTEIHGLGVRTDDPEVYVL
jgi:hypothetical protein